MNSNALMKDGQKPIKNIWNQNQKDKKQKMILAVKTLKIEIKVKKYLKWKSFSCGADL